MENSVNSNQQTRIMKMIVIDCEGNLRDTIAELLKGM